ncbi:hypothetical protein F7U66_01810 [Vibrio parahaemolyticus]|nr:hypothetical protein [Vibrio parahaemolyticus]
MRYTRLMFMLAVLLPVSSHAFIDGIGDIVDSAGKVGSIAKDVADMDLSGAIDGDMSSLVGDVDLGVFNDPNLHNQVGNVVGVANVTKEVPPPWSVVDELGYTFEHDFADFANTLDCLEYQFIGICFSWRMTWRGPRFYTNTIVEHYVRDTHIEVRDSVAREGMDEKTVTDIFSGGIVSEVLPMMDFFDIPLSGESKFSPSSLKKNGSDQATRYRDGHSYKTREVLVMGNGIDGQIHQSTLGGIIGLFGWCNSPNMPLVPYYSSLLDSFSWRYMPIVETLLYGPYSAATFSMADIGDDFGHTFPRHNRVYTPSNFKAAVVAATRGMHIAASNETIFNGMAGLHVHAPMGQYSPGSWTRSFYKTKQNTKSLKLEMFYPHQEGERCTDYGSSKSFLNDPRELKFNDGNSHASAGFKGYRPFRCCRRRGNHISDIVVVPPKL